MNNEEQIDINIAIEYMKQDMVECLKTANIAFERKDLSTNRYFIGMACGNKNSLKLFGREVRFEYEWAVDGRAYVKSMLIDGIETVMADLEENCEEKKEEMKL